MPCTRDRFLAFAQRALRQRFADWLRMDGQIEADAADGAENETINKALQTEKSGALFVYVPEGVRIGWCEEGRRMRRHIDQGRRLLGAALALSGVLLVFVCMPVEVLLLALGVALTAAGLLLLRC